MTNSANLRQLLHSLNCDLGTLSLLARNLSRQVTKEPGNGKGRNQQVCRQVGRALKLASKVSSTLKDVEQITCRAGI